MSRPHWLPQVSPPHLPSTATPPAPPPHAQARTANCSLQVLPHLPSSVRHGHGLGLHLQLRPQGPRVTLESLTSPVSFASSKPSESARNWPLLLPPASTVAFWTIHVARLRGAPLTSLLSPVPRGLVPEGLSQVTISYSTPCLRTLQQCSISTVKV